MHPSNILKNANKSGYLEGGKKSPKPKHILDKCKKWIQRHPEGPRRTQKDPEEPRKTQKNPERPRRTNKAPKAKVDWSLVKQLPQPNIFKLVVCKV